MNSVADGLLDDTRVSHVSPRRSSILRDPPLRRRNKIAAVEFTAAVTHEAPSYVARCLDVDVTSQGSTFEEALANLKEALELHFEDEALPDALEPPIIVMVSISA
jgi:predicted RNase H-like HicB family nuclease